MEEGFARGGELHVVPISCEEVHPDFRFQPSYLLRERWLSGSESARRRTEMEMLGHGNEVAQSPEIYC
jgi:hypothetical protein